MAHADYAERKYPSPPLEPQLDAHRGIPQLISYPRRTGFSGLQYTVLKSADLFSWTPVPDGYLAETTQPVSGKPLEMVTARIVDASGGGFLRLQVTSIQP